ncbi:MFS transporter [Bartonella doshiae]|uniref:Inner membrane metabolite transport protein yhjE n=2 Tax=Bartonella doshiae TaxID=33044 RepID=A0A380ZEE2_BARDO|nr:MFS transporter [Bartonella doshiae]EJF81891.1 MFS transporter, metabolite:H+ symporter (MHS) family protein [Bartonella doshiae NCTC 12862 = ATCC 700133]MBB6159397.1 metabolite-proton symporter [Bartonella doshiae]SUV44682.1 Inner membrane metabolite transport protein yhjE [Bartonella doshiae]
MYTNSKIQDISKRNSPRRILLASLIGPTIEFFDFYVFATAAALIFPHLFFPTQNDQLAILQSFLIFGAAFFARPFGSIVFGHFGDKIGRKVTLIASLLTMGMSTVIIGFLPTYETAGWWAPFFLTLCRIGQGMGLGGEWGGAVLLATENAPPEKRGWYAMFPQLGVPIGLFLSIAVYLGLLHFLDYSELLAWGWRIPFIASVIFMIIGLWIRLSINETIEFKKTLENKERVKVPIIDVFFKCPRILFLGIFAGMATFVLFYLVTAYLLSYSTNHLKLPFHQALQVEVIGAIFCGIFTVITGKLSDRIKRRTLMIWITIITGIYSFAIPYFLNSGVIGVLAMSIIGLSIMGMIYSPLGAVLASPYPTEIRYTGASITFNLSGIVGASLAPYIAEYLVQHFNTSYIGYYLLLSSFISLICFVGFTEDEISN